MQILLTMLLLISVVGCGVDELSARLPSAQGSFGNETRPPTGYYRALLASRFNVKDMAGTDYSKVFLNFGGGEVFRGFEKNESFLLCNDSVTINPAALTVGEQEAIFDEVRNFFNVEDVPLDLVLDEPLRGDYSTVHIGGWHHSLGCRGHKVLGSAPSDHGNVNPADVGFVFNNTQELLPRAIAHVVGRMNGLPLQNQAHDSVMGRHISAHTPLTLSEQERQILREQHNATAHIAGDELPGEIFIDTISATLDELDADEVLDIKPLQGELRVLVPAEVKLPALARALTAIHVLGFDSDTFKKSNKWSKIKSILGKVLKNTILNSITKHKDVRGNVAESISEVLGNTLRKDKDTQERRLTRLPDLSTLLEIDTLTSRAQLFPMMQAQRQWLDHNLTGTEHDSMLSLLKVGYFQRLTEMP